MTTPEHRRIEADWLLDESLQSILAALVGPGDEEARVVGGAIRNTLMGKAVTDIDIATTALPEITVARLEAAGFKTVPTGIEHGTITAIAKGRPYEVTTLRRDIETDGRHAKVLFGRSWQADAERRDFTINALYADADGAVIDLVGGLPDLDRKVLRFIGDAETRIEEDYLRILRFFRFFAWYGEGRPDAAGLRAATRLKSGLSRLSAERVWAELKKLFGAPDPSRALLWMRQTGVLGAVLPESEKWGIDAIHGLMEAERALGWPADALLRLQAIVPPDEERMAALAKRLRLSNADRDRLIAWAAAGPVPAETTASALRSRLYFGEPPALADRLRLGLASARVKAQGADMMALAEVASLGRMLGEAEGFAPPPFPVSGDDLKKAGIAAGPALGKALDELRRAWVDSGFVLSRERLLERL
ncbi:MULTISPECIES: CCA tRNA nucleotidyltransferase [unclassified Aureimonas]|uniref:CCA tRNA nucleotidyltransferase n=1 Tax=unclassified Aureimonas TaxID=2615206 RepID=UPI0006FD07D6|nr:MULTISPECIES: CCA tRNA nucleotidyltransferase [unclassified Aureimonas]KQT66119.1 poly(A) polymerase [Aureimonas sp. Leaf427]KQT81017.1 poly(A) polymerase [Aureimonas sp. Leaf460]